MEKIIWFVFILAFVIAFMFAFSYGSELQVKKECQQLAVQKANYPLFFYSDWQAEMCGIKK